MTKTAKWNTPPTLPGGRVCRTLTVPDSTEWLGVVTGALLALTIEYNWEQLETTDLTPAAAAAAALTLVNAMLETTRACMIGDIVASLKPDLPAPPEGYLALNGQQVNRVDYPELYAVIDPTWRITADVMQLPDFRGRLPAGIDRFGANGTIVLPGAVAGSRTKTLAITNLPSHAHNFKEFTVVSIKNPATGTNTNVASASSQQPTSLVGSGTPLDIMPPNIAVYWYVIAR